MKMNFISILALTMICSNLILGQNLVQAITLDANQAILLDNHVTPLGEFNSSSSYSAIVSGNTTMPMQGSMFMYYDNSSFRFDYVPFTENGISFTPGGGAYKIAPFIVDWSKLLDNVGDITVNISVICNCSLTINVERKLV